ncbi:DEAD/DEAH box helicase [Crocinitomicaceae bacterium]|nr:DEAD/DEAH box helicase [Crocinitomicaceae bacterium]
MKILDSEICDHSIDENILKLWPFKLSPFQKNAIAGLLNNKHVLVSAHTGSGKTLPAEFTIKHFTSKGKRVIYTSPLKALTNQKYHDLTLLFPDISFGLLTGDNKFNPEAQVLLMTQEILRNTLFQQQLFNDSGALSNDESNIKTDILTFEMDIENELGAVIMDEAHFIVDKGRGIVWEETLMMLPNHIQLCLLTATLAKPERFCKLIEGRGGPEVWVCPTKKRVVPLTHTALLTMPESNFKTMKSIDKIKHEDNFNKFVTLKTADGQYMEKNYHSLQKTLNYLDLKRIRVNQTFVLNQAIKLLKERNALPAIIFIFSRKKVNQMASKIQIPLFEEDSKIPSIIEKECESMLRKKLTNYKEYLLLPEYRFIIGLLRKGIAIHHAGILKEFREMIEMLFGKKYIKVLLATETFAMGINMPAKASVFTSVQKFDGKNFRTILPWEYIQMAGRAGRRGIDDKGLVLILLNLCNRDPLTSTEMCHMLTGDPQSMESRFVIHSNLLLRLISVGNMDFKEFIGKSMMNEDIENQKKEVLNNLSNLKIKQEKKPFYRTDIDNLKQLYTLNQHIEMLSGKKKKKRLREISNLEGTTKFIKEDYQKYLDTVQLEKDSVYFKKRLQSIESFIDDEINIQIKMLIDTQFVYKTEEGILSLTEKGKIAVTLQELAPLPFAEIIENGTLNDLDTKEIIAVLSCFTNMHLSDEMTVHSIASININEKVRGAITAVKKTYNKYFDILIEQKLGIVDNYEMHYNMVELAYKWCDSNDNASCMSIINQAKTYDISLGDFVKAILKINNIIQELEKAATISEDVSLIEKIREIPVLTLKSCITNQSLYL